MRFRSAPWAIAAVGVAVLLGGCTGGAQVYSSGKPIVLQPPGAIRLRSRPERVVTRPPCSTCAPAEATPGLSAAEKQRLFQRFQETQSRTAETATVRPATP